jgi:hypothetical protein
VKKHGLYIVSLILLWLPNEVIALERKNWIFPQLSTLSGALQSSPSGLQISLSNLTYDSFSSTQASLLLNAKHFELGLKASGRLLHQIGVGRTALNNSLKDWDHSYSIEVARRFVSPTGRFGRLGLAIDTFSPAQERFLQVALDTGILDSPKEPELMTFSFHLFQPLHSYSDTRLSTHIDFARVLSQTDQASWKLGLGLGWIYHLSQEQEVDNLLSVPDKTLQSEHMFLSLNPHIGYRNDFLAMKLAVPIRLFIDKQWQLRDSPQGNISNVRVTSYPFDLANPDIWLSVTFLI